MTIQDPNANTFTFDELRIALMAFALWMRVPEAQSVVDRFLVETIEDE